jgi:NitT/TauT family transport system permease protein
MSQKQPFYFSYTKDSEHTFNRWDLLLLLLVIAALFFLGWSAEQMVRPYKLGEAVHISLRPYNLPIYAIKSVTRLFIALCFSLLFTLIVGTWAAKNRRAEQIIIPLLDILQSVPVLSFLSITVVGFIKLFPNTWLGPECAAIFAIFTAQVWNMALGFYQSLKMVPHDLKEVAAMFHLSSWQRFWKIEVPFSMPSLLWNMMMSMSASWFFVVISEAISVSHQDIRLPGIGSYIALAIAQKNMLAVGYAIITMMFVIALYDQLLFRPLIAWSDKFKPQGFLDDESESWLIDWIRRSKLMHRVYLRLERWQDKFLQAKFLNKKIFPVKSKQDIVETKWRNFLWLIVWVILTGVVIWQLSSFFWHHVTSHEILKTFLYTSYTAFRVIILIILSSLIWVPVGVWIGQRSHIAAKVQPIIQLLAAFPANLFYPVFVLLIVTYNLNVEIWLTPLMILGTQWYILFNVIAGASSLPRELYLVADNFGLKGLLWWRRLALPGVFPYYITGAISAAGGAWNASIVAEWVSWGNTTLRATGIGSYIQASTIAGDFPRLALGTVMMCIYVLALNHLIWRPLYRLAQQRFNLT